jgi:antitoxin ParD1/3/4
MAKTTSFILGDELDAFVRKQVDEGRYPTASDVIRHALERLADQERKLEWVHSALDEGLASGPPREGAFDRVLKRLESLERSEGRKAAGK